MEQVKRAHKKKPHVWNLQVRRTYGRRPGKGTDSQGAGRADKLAELAVALQLVTAAHSRKAGRK